MAVVLCFIIVVNIIHWILSTINPSDYKESFPWFRVYVGTLGWTHLIACALQIFKPKKSGELS